MLLLALLACSPKTPPAPVEAEATVTVPLVAMNDFHGALYEQPVRDDPSKALGGLPVLAGAIDALRAEEPDLVLLDGGDVFQGSWPVNATKGRGSVDAFDLLGVDAAAIGNHEFDYGQGGPDSHPLRGALEEALAAADFSWLTANVWHDGAPWQPEGLAPWTMIERRGVKIGVIGLTTVETPQTTLLRHVEDLEFRDVVETVRETLPALEAAGADVVAVVGHLTGDCETKGYLEIGETCEPDGEIGRLLTELPEGTIDVLVVGHAHTLMAHRVGDTFVLEARSRGHALNRLDLVVGPDGVDPDASTLHAPWPLVHDRIDPGCGDGEYPLDPLVVGGRTITPSAAALELVQAYEAEAGSLCDEIGCSEERLGRAREAESAVGSLVADLMLAAFDADLAVTNSGGLRADLPGGSLRREHLHAVMPFDNRLLVIEMTGAQVRRMLRLGSSGAHGILQIAGGTYAFDPDATGGTDLDGDGDVGSWERDRLCSASVAGEALDPERTYRVVTTDFLYEGGDHLGHAFEGTSVAEEGPLLRDLLFSAIADHTETTGTCISPADGGPRIVLGACEAAQ